MNNLKEIFQLSSSQCEGDNHQFQLTWKVPKNLPYFNGHFPNNPILPGVGLLDLILTIFQIRQNQPTLKFKSIRTAKFMDIIRPEDTIKVEFSFNEKMSIWSSLFKNEQDKIVSKINFYLEATKSSTIE